MRRRICFLFNHDEIHQMAHSLPVAKALTNFSKKTQIEIAVSSPAQGAFAEQHLKTEMRQGCISLKYLELPPMINRITTKLSRFGPARRLMTLRAHLEYFQTFDSIVVPEFTSTLLKSRWNVTKPKLICIPHGTGDRSVGFSDELRYFDLILVAGPKTRRRMITLYPELSKRVNICGYPKFDMIARRKPQRLFKNEKPIVVYNPHFDPRLSSWYRFGPALLRYFAQQNNFNLVFAPHVMLFRKLLHGSMENFKFGWTGKIPRDVLDSDNIIFDTGSISSVDMTYTLAGDIYLGDVSSQIYEWILNPRPSIFLNAHKAQWEDNENYAHWRLGPVIKAVEDLPERLRLAIQEFEKYRPIQIAARAETFSTTRVSASHRAAHAILRLTHGLAEI